MSDGAIGEAMAMDQFTLESVVRDQLLDRREKLEEAVALNGDFEFASLLGDVDTALAKLDHGTYGQCEACDGHIEPERLLADPLVRVCLSELSDTERAALENDLELAAAIQNGLLPRSVNGNGAWKADFVYEPAGIIGGDYCDIIPEGDDLYFILGDVSGKGMAASLLMSSLHAMFHTLIPLGLPLEEIMARANHLLCESSPASQYATLVFGKASKSGEVEIVNAGHLPPIIIKHGVIGEFDFSGLPLGMFCSTQFNARSIDLAPGDVMLIFTDGVTETFDPDGMEFGTQRLIDSINGSCEPGELIRHCLQQISGFRRDAARHDDLTMLALTLV